MSTPTPTIPPQPSSASKKATGHATTPSHMGGFSSPAPRSVPSPAATRKDHAGKTPTNHPTVSSQGSKTLGSTPMMQNLSQTGMTVGSSPGGQNASFGTPSGLPGLSMDLGSATPGQLGMNTPMMGGVGMIPTMSELGLTLSGGKRNEDEDRKMKMRKVLKSIGKPKGRISEEAILRVSRRVGFDADVDKSGTEIAIAGNKTIIEVRLQEHEVRDVKVEINSEPWDPSQPIGAPMAEQSAHAAKVLLQDLTVSGSTLLESSLDRYAANLQRLAKIDRLVASGGVNCFEALNGIYKCLHRLHVLEIAKARLEQRDQSTDLVTQHKPESEVICKNSGKTDYNEAGLIALSLQYWMGHENLSNSRTDESAMDVDGAETLESQSEANESSHSLRIEVESSSAAMYPSIRTSDAWLPEIFELSATESGEHIPWQEPSPTYVFDPTIDQNANMAMNGTQRMPDVRFIARLDPPLVMPWQTVLNILSAVGIQQPPQVFMPVHYHAMLLNIPAQAVHDDKAIRAEQIVLSKHEDTEIDAQHCYTLEVSKLEWGHKLEEIPFSHPRQLIELLPTLRQWACVGSLLRNAFKGEFDLINATHVATNGVRNVQTNGVANGVAEADDISLDSILNPPRIDSTSLQVNIGLATSPQPTLSITSSNPSGTKIHKVIAQILPNADILVAHCEDEENEMNVQSELVVGDDMHSDRAKKLARALAVAGDLGVWIEWMRSTG